jgi:hypothetical protein
MAGVLAALVLCLPAAAAGAQESDGAADPVERQEDAQRTPSRDDDALAGAAWRWDGELQRWVPDDVARAEDADGAPGTTSVTGEFHSQQLLNLDGRVDGETLVKVRFADGRARLVDLGPRMSPAELGVQRGDRVRLEGRVERIDGLDVLLANRIRIEGEDEQAGSRAALDGTVQRVRRVESADGAAHVLVDVEVAGGESRLVCLGPEQDAALVPERGERIALRGSGRGAARGTPVAAALNEREAASTRSADHARSDVARADDATATGDGAPAIDDKARTDNVPDAEEISGRIESAWKLQLDGTGANHTLVKLALENGQHAIVDFGVERTLDRIDLDDGEAVWIRGVREQVSGVPIFRAQEVRIDGELHVLPPRGAAGSLVDEESGSD